jgi:lipopolysaccharide export system protein LptA
VADGGVKITQTAADRKRIGTSEHAEYYVGDGRVVLEGGQPQMVDSVKGTTQGAKLTYFQANDRLLVNGIETQPAISNIQRK